MERIREGRRATNMAAPPNGLSSSRRRHRSGSLRDSPDEDGTMEVQEQGRLRDRGLVKKDRDRDRDRDRERDRERERLSRSKRRRENRMVSHHTNAGSDRDDGDDTSDESGNEEEEDDDDDRMLHPSTSASVSVSSNYHHQSHNSNSHPQQQIHHRKSFSPAVSNKVFRAAPAAAPPSWKAADEMIGFSVPRKARTGSGKASAKWTPDWKSGVGGTGIDRQSSTSPVRLASSAASPAPAAPPSPSSSNVSVRKKMKANGGGSKQPRPPKSSSKSSSSNPEELEIEIAEVLYGLMTQSQAPAKKEIPSSSDTKSRVSSPISNSTALPQNSTSLSTIAPKRKRPRQVSENPISSSMKTEIDHHQHHQSPKTDRSSYLENNSPASSNPAAENGVSSFGFTTLPGHKAANPLAEQPVVVSQMLAEEDKKIGVGVLLTKEDVKESSTVKLNDGNSKNEAVITTAASTTVTNLELINPESKKDEKFEIDLMAPPPQQRTSQGSDGDVDFSDHKPMPTQETSKTKEDDNPRKSNTQEQKVETIQETGESSKQGVNEEINIQLNINLEKPKGNANMVSSSSNRSLQQALKHQQFSAKSETHSEKTAQSSSIPMPKSVANWPPMGYVAPLQGVISMDGNTMASAPFQPQPIFTHPRPKRCATHCYIARNIHCNQQFMKMNPFWPAASASAAPMFGAKPSNVNLMPSTELHANIPQSMQDKGQTIGLFPGYTTGKEAKSSQSANITDPAQRKQQVLIQQAMPPVVPNNLLHGPAFIFPFNQQQAVTASASVRPGSSKVTTSTATGGLGAASGPSNSATVSSSSTAAVPALSFNYQNMSASETQYLAILQNNPYSFPMPAVGAPPNYRPGPHAQAMPLFNGSFYSSQMIHPSQIPQPPQQQATPPTQAQNHHPSQSQQTHQNSSGSTSSQKHLQAQQRQQASGATAVNGSGSGNGGSLQSGYPASHKSRSQQPTQLQNLHMNPSQVRHLENEVTGGEDSPSTADSRVSRAANTMGPYNHNFAVPARSKAFGQMDHPNGALTKTAGAAVTTSANSNDKKHQQQQSQQQGLKRGGVESSLQPQAFAMSFAPMNGTTGNITMAQNHAIFQSMPESVRQGYHMMAAPTAAAHQSLQKDFRISEETPRTGHDPSNAGEKVSSGLTAKSGQSIAFSRPDLATDASGSNNLSSRSPISTSTGTAAQSSLPLHVQYQQQQQQQQVLQLQKQQQNQNINNARTKNPPSSNGSVYPDHVITSSSSMVAKFPNSISSFPLQTSNASSSLVQSPQWRNSVRGPTTSQIPSSIASATTTSSIKNLHQPQQQSSRSHPQSHTQISFGSTASQKLQPTTVVQMQQQQQQQNPNPSSNSGTQSPSPPMLVGSPTTSISGSPRTNVSASISSRTGQASSLSSSQPAKNSPVATQRSSPSILGNPNSNFTKSQQQLPKQTLQQQKGQPMMMYSHPLMQAQAQAQQHAASSMSPAQAMMMYNNPVRLQQQQQQSSQQPTSSSSTAMLSLSPPVTHANTATSDPAKAIAAATSMMNHTQYSAAAAQSMPAGFPPYVHNAPAAAAVQVKPAEQKQPAA